MCDTWYLVHRPLVFYLPRRRYEVQNRSVTPLGSAVPAGPRGRPDYFISYEGDVSLYVVLLYRYSGSFRVQECTRTLYQVRTSLALVTNSYNTSKYSVPGARHGYAVSAGDFDRYKNERCARSGDPPGIFLPGNLVPGRCFVFWAYCFLRLTVRGQRHAVNSEPRKLVTARRGRDHAAIARQDLRSSSSSTSGRGCRGTTQGCPTSILRNRLK